MSEPAQEPFNQGNFPRPRTGHRLIQRFHPTYFFNTTTPQKRPELWKSLFSEFGTSRRETKVPPEISPCNHGFASHAAAVLRRDLHGLREIDHRAKKTVRVTSSWRWRCVSGHQGAE